MQTIERKARKFNQLVIPRELQRQLPFKDKPKVAKKKVDKVQEKRVAVVRSKKDKQVLITSVRLVQEVVLKVTTCLFSCQVADLMKMLKTVHAQKRHARRIEMRMRAAQHQKERSKIDEKKEARTKDMKKNMFRIQGKLGRKPTNS